MCLNPTFPRVSVPASAFPLLVLPGGTLATLEILPGYYRSLATSTDIRECFFEDACEGGDVAGEYCATGYTGPCKTHTSISCGLAPMDRAQHISRSEQC